jgi:hypothetical protein
VESRGAVFQCQQRRKVFSDEDWEPIDGPRRGTDRGRFPRLLDLDLGTRGGAQQPGDLLGRQRHGAGDVDLRGAADTDATIEIMTGDDDAVVVSVEQYGAQDRDAALRRSETPRNGDGVSQFSFHGSNRMPTKLNYKDVAATQGLTRNLRWQPI